MSAISDLLNQIKTAIYGKEVRGAIHDAIEQCYDDVTTSATRADTAADRAEEIIEQLPTDYSDRGPLIAPVEETNIASRHYSAGEYLIYNNVLYKVVYGVEEGYDFRFNVTPVSGGVLSEVPNIVGGVVKYDEQQHLSSTEKTQALSNIGGVSTLMHTLLEDRMDKLIGGVRGDVNASGFSTGNEFAYFTYDRRIAFTEPVNVNYQGDYFVTSRMAIVECTEGDVFYITGQAFSDPYGLYAFVDASGNILSRSESDEIAENKRLVAPADATHLVVNMNVNYIGWVMKNEPIRNGMWNVVPSIDISDVIDNSTGKWTTTGQYKGTITRIAGAKKLCIKAGNNICFYSFLTSGIIKTGETPYYATGISGLLQIQADSEKTVDVPSDAVYLYMLSKNKTGGDALPNSVIAYGKQPDQILAGLNVSLIGDSISAFTGTIPAENLAYYTRSNAGVRAATEMWWYHFAEITGCELLINDSWSGSPVTDVRSPSRTAMADPSRCQNIHTWDFGTSDDYDLIVTSENIGALRQSPFRKYARAYQVGDYLKKVSPDVVLIAGGGNDYNQNAGLGTWDGHTTLNTSDISTFREAYANMINRIHEAYPNALIVCIKPWYWRQPETAKEQAITNSSGKTYKDYWDAICDVADLMSCPVIDGIAVGFNPWNYYPTFCEDSASNPVHPNAMGQKVIGETMADAMSRTCIGYIEWMKNK